MAQAMLLKEEGNRHFQVGDFAGAESLYSKAIIMDPKNPTLYTNRAMARLKLKMWESTISDCTDCLKLSPDNFKAHYYMAQAMVELGGDPDGALTHASRAHELCAAANDRSLAKVAELVLRCKKERWEERERRRERDDAGLEAEVLGLLDRELDESLAACDDGDEATRSEIAEEYRVKAERIRGVFERSRAAASRRREVPDWAIDDIGFGIMVDPVITKTGKSYERATIMEHLKRHPTDPLTREPLLPSELRPNLGLKQACDEFLEENGWAVDW